jgi:hypothetical protein
LSSLDIVARNYAFSSDEYLMKSSSNLPTRISLPTSPIFHSKTINTRRLPFPTWQPVVTNTIRKIAVADPEVESSYSKEVPVELDEKS